MKRPIPAVTRIWRERLGVVAAAHEDRGPAGHGAQILEPQEVRQQDGPRNPMDAGDRLPDDPFDRPGGGRTRDAFGTTRVDTGGGPQPIVIEHR